ncbi:hypothetical protein AC249_AIPGENE22000, partial [Exaiptasia diaphana]
EKEIAKKPKNVATEIKTEEKEVEKKTVPQKRQFSKAVLKGSKSEEPKKATKEQDPSSPKRSYGARRRSYVARRRYVSRRR